MPIAGKIYPTKIGELDHLDLQYYDENPRVYTALGVAQNAPDQKEIENFLQSETHVKKLSREIISQGGNTEKVVVRDKSFIVLEGNSRLAAFRLIKGKEKFEKIRCEVLPSEIEEDHIFAYLS